MKASKYQLPQKRFISISELKDIGFTYYHINILVDKNILKKLNRQNYENLNYEGDESDFYYVGVYVPRGVICLTTSAIYWQLSSERSMDLEVAIPRSSKVYTMPEWPKIKLYYYSNMRYNTGITKVKENSYSFSIYDMEKTVIDVIYYREKLGIEVAKEVLIQYLANKDRNLNKLYRYAKELGNSEILRTYLEVLL